MHSPHCWLWHIHRTKHLSQQMFNICRSFTCVVDECNTWLIRAVAHKPNVKGTVLYRYYKWLPFDGLNDYAMILLTFPPYGFGTGSQCWYISHETSSLFHHSVLVDLSVSMMMH